MSCLWIAWDMCHFSWIVTNGQGQHCIPFGAIVQSVSQSTVAVKMTGFFWMITPRGTAAISLLLRIRILGDVRHLRHGGNAETKIWYWAPLLFRNRSRKFLVVAQFGGKIMTEKTKRFVHALISSNACRLLTPYLHLCRKIGSTWSPCGTVSLSSSSLVE